MLLAHAQSIFDVMLNIEITLLYYVGYEGRSKNNSNTSSGEFGMATLGPTGDINGWILAGCNLEDYMKMWM